MIYTHQNKNFRTHVHPTLQRRIRMFFIIGGISLAVVGYDVITGVVGPLFAVLAILIGGIVGFFTSRIFHLSWSHDGQHVLGRVDRIGWFVLAAYIAFEIARAVLFETVIHVGTASTTAITFAFVSSALLSRMLGLRGRILRILKAEKVFG